MAISSQPSPYSNRMAPSSEPSNSPPTESERSPLSNEELFTNAAWNFQTRSFRLETLPDYDVNGDDLLFKAHRSGGEMPTPNKSWNDWFSRLKQASQEGKEFTRVHIVPPELTDYLKYEIGWAYRNWNAPAGERIFIIQRDANPWIAKLIVGDFFLFDDNKVALINYDSSNRWIGNEWEKSPIAIEWYRQVRDILLRQATPLQTFIESLR